MAIIALYNKLEFSHLLTKKHKLLREIYAGNNRILTGLVGSTASACIAACMSPTTNLVSIIRHSGSTASAPRYSK